MQRNRISVRKFLGALAAAAVLYFGLGALLHYVVFPEEEPPAWAYGRSGFSFETPTGERFRLIHGPIETGGEFSEAHFDLLPGGHAGRPHVHPHQEERFEVMSGSLTALVGDEERVVSAGEILVVPPGTPHQPFNRGDVEMRSIARITPAGKLGLFFGQLSGLGFNPTFLQTMLFVQAYERIPRNSSAGGRAGDVLPSRAHGTASRIPQLLPGACKAVSRVCRPTRCCS